MSTLILILFFLILLGVLVLSAATLSYVQRIHAWHLTCKRIEIGRDTKVEIMTRNEEGLGEMLSQVTERQQQIALLLVSLTNAVLSLSQEQRRSSPPPKGDA